MDQPRKPRKRPKNIAYAPCGYFLRSAFENTKTPRVQRETKRDASNYVGMFIRKVYNAAAESAQQRKVKVIQAADVGFAVNYLVTFIDSSVVSNISTGQVNCKGAPHFSKTGVVREAKKDGPQMKVSENAKCAFQYVAHEYIKKIAKSAARYATNSKRKTILQIDLKMAVEDLGM